MLIANALCKNTTITALNLKSNGIDSDGVKAAATMIAQNQVLQHLSLTYHLFHDPGSEAIFDAFGEGCSLKSLDLSENAISKANLTAFQKYKENNEWQGLLLPPYSAPDLIDPLFAF